MRIAAGDYAVEAVWLQFDGDRSSARLASELADLSCTSWVPGYIGPLAQELHSSGLPTHALNLR